jgi:peptide/nickel transport system permease protein
MSVVDAIEVLEAAPVRRWAGGQRVRLRLYVALAIIALYTGIAAFGPMVSGFNFNSTDVVDRLLPPLGHAISGRIVLLGTDPLGRSLAGELVQGARISLLVGGVTVAIAVLLGTSVGVTAGYFGGWIDGLLMRLVDVQFAFPSILLAILIAGSLGQSVVNVIISLTLASWVVFARIVRGETIATRNSPYVEASRVLGARAPHIIRHAILPASFTPVAIYATVQLGFVIVAEASLSFLGVGLPPTDVSWGTTIASGQDYLGQAWWVSTIPGIALAILVLCIGIVGDELGERYLK